MDCCKEFSDYCCLCRANCSPGSMGGWIRIKRLNGHSYCFDCYPKMVDLYIAEKKLGEFDAK